ncbi:MAG TPA: hypothetical protein IAC49_06700 [Candidatus Ventricola intestinavium]|nr:hypothetical protein [Candidatus Ventricola intestinavium]
MAERQTRKNGALRDPLRSAMMAHIEGMPLLLLCAALCAAFCFAALNLCAQMEGAVWIALAGTLGVALLMLGIGKTVRGQPVIVLLCAALLAMVAVGAHLAMLDIRPARMSNVLQPMLDGMWNYELVTAMAWEENAWSGVYLIVMGLVSRLERFPQMYALKLFDMICQCGAALAILRLARMRGAKPLGALMAMFAGVLAPTMLFNAGCWAQCDATFALFMLWGLALLLEDHPLAGCILWGVALGTKLQSAFLFPLLIVWWMNGRVSLRHILVLAAAFVACQAAILLDGQGWTALLTRYAQQLEIARNEAILTDHAPGVYGLMVVASVREFSGMGLYLGIASALLVVAALLRARRPLDADGTLLAALLLAAGLPLILPQMNARCLYLAGLLAFICANSPRRMLVAGMLEFISFCSYMEAVFSKTVLPITVLSILAIAVAALIAQELIALLTDRGGSKGALANEGQA